jgi:hypothetical protein
LRERRALAKVREWLEGDGLAYVGSDYERLFPAILDVIDETGGKVNDNDGLLVALQREGSIRDVDNDTTLALDALRAGLRKRRPAAGLVHHSDRGSPYASSEYRATLARHDLVAHERRYSEQCPTGPQARAAPDTRTLAATMLESKMW